MTNPRVEQWPDGTEKRCDACEQPIYTMQPTVSNMARKPEKRKVWHAQEECSGNEFRMFVL